LHQSFEYIVNSIVYSVIRRYDYALEKYPYLRELTDNEISSYIGINRETLTRAKANQLQNNKK
jgi:hypothetical protein